MNKLKMNIDYYALKIWRKFLCLFLGHDKDSFYLNPKYNPIRWQNRKYKFKANEKIIYCQRCSKEWGTGIIKEINTTKH